MPDLPATRRTLVVCLGLVALAAAAAYGNTLADGFVLDDTAHVDRALTSNLLLHILFCTLALAGLWTLTKPPLPSRAGSRPAAPRRERGSTMRAFFCAKRSSRGGRARVVFASQRGALR
jgi:hypothetical protein